MTATRVYLDWNATAPLRPEARAAMIAALDLVGNPSSVHAEGRAARAAVETARAEVAALVSAQPGEVVFTSGATEANAWALRRGHVRVILPGVEHVSVAAAARSGGGAVVEAPVDGRGLVDCAAVESLLAGAGAGTLLAVQIANNETGVIQPVKMLAALAAAAGATLHTDAVQAAGRVPLDVHDLGVTTLALSAHKLGGPKGVGALVVRDGVALPPMVVGGGQERRRRAGTENVAAIVGFGAAAAAARRELDQMAQVGALRDRLEREVSRITPDAVVIGARAPRLPNTSCFAVPGRSAETLVIKLDLAGFAVSAGAACSSGKVGPSAVLAAMGLSPEIARGAIRVSLGAATTAADIDAFLAAWAAVTARPARGQRASAEPPAAVHRLLCMTA